MQLFLFFHAELRRTSKSRIREKASGCADARWGDPDGEWRPHRQTLRPRHPLGAQPGRAGLPDAVFHGSMMFEGGPSCENRNPLAAAKRRLLDVPTGCRIAGRHRLRVRSTRCSALGP